MRGLSLSPSLSLQLEMGYHIWTSNILLNNENKFIVGMRMN